MGRSLARPAILAGLLAAVFAAPDAGAVVRYLTKQLTTNGVDDVAPRLQGGRVVWQHDSGANADIWMWTGSAVVPVTSGNGLDDEAPAIDGNTIVWQQNDGHDFEIVAYDVVGGMITYLTNNGGDDLDPVISGNLVAWQGPGASGRDVFLFTLPSTPGQLTGDPEVDADIGISGQNVVFTKEVGTLGQLGYHHEIWANYPAAQPPGLYQITQGPGDDTQPAISGDRIVWVEGSGSAAEIWRYDPNDQNQPLLQLTNDSLEDTAPQIDGNTIVWQHWDGHDYEIFSYTEGGSVVQLTNNDVDDVGPRISGPNVVWQQNGAADSDIWVSWALGTPKPITFNDVIDRNPRIDGQEIVWEECLPEHGCEIMLAPEPGAAALAAAALLVLGALARRR
jgi:beta propeller repeat protein